MKKFTKTTWRLLDERLQMVLAGGTPPWTRKRTFFYKCRMEFQREWKLPEIDLSGANPYGSWGTCVNTWAAEHCSTLDIGEGRFWEVLGKLNIWPHERGICFRYTYGNMEEVMVNHETKDKIKEDCSFIVVSEKETLCRDLCEALSIEGYKGTIIAMGGHNTGTVQSITAEVADELQRLKAENFFILSLHDFDLDGLTMVMTLRKWFSWVVDVGINRGFLKFSKIDKDRLVWEAVVNRKDIPKLRGFVKVAPEYTRRDLTRLHGKQTGPKRWEGKRIEIDSVYAKYGIEPFINYIRERLKDVPCWDLTRIGIEKQELEEGKNLFDEARDNFNTEVGRVYGEKVVELSQTAEKIREVVRGNLYLPVEFSDLKKRYVKETGDSSFLRFSDDDTEKYWTYEEVKVKTVGEIYDQYPTDKDYKTEYQEKLDKEVNEKLECWKGDVSTAVKDIEEKVGKLQSGLDSDKEHDSDLEKFEKELDEVDWGEDDLKDIKPTDPVEEIDMVIEALVELRTEIQEAGAVIG